MRTRSLSILATTATLAALLGCPIEGLKTPDAASLGAESDSVGGVANSANHDDAVDAAEDVSWADEQLPAGKSALRVLMTDAPVEADSVFVTFCGIFVEPAMGDVGGRDPGVAPDPRGEAGAGAGGAYGGRDGGAAGAAGAPSGSSSAGTGGSGAGGAAGAPSPESDAEKMEAERRAEAERAEAESAAGADGAAPSDPEREAAEREAAEREAAEREAEARDAAGGLPTDDRGGADAVDPAMEDGAPREAWRPLNQECQTLDLLTLRNGVTEAVGVATLPPGHYAQIRLMLVDASIVVDGVEHELRVPSGMESGLKIQGGFELLDGAATTITLDFDAGRSVQYTEGSGYQLTPVINIVDMISHADGPGADPRDPALPGTDPGREPPREGAGGSAGAGAGGAAGDGAGGRASVPPPPPGAEPPPSDMPEQPEPPKAGDEPQPDAPPPPADEPPPAEEPEEP